MHSKKFFAVFFVLCMLSTDFMIPAVLAGQKNRGHNGIELLLAAGILAKLLRKKGGGGGGHHHHHHGHHHHGHHHGSGSRTVEVVHVAPPMGGYSSHYPTTAQSYTDQPSYGSHASYGGQSPYGASQAATTTFSSSIEYPFSAVAASQGMPQHLPYGEPYSSAAYVGYQPQPVEMMPPMPMQEAPGSVHA